MGGWGEERGFGEKHKSGEELKRVGTEGDGAWLLDPAGVGGAV